MPGIRVTPAMSRKLAKLKIDFLTMNDDDASAFVESLRLRRRRPDLSKAITVKEPKAPKVKVIKEPKPKKEPKQPKPKKVKADGEKTQSQKVHKAFQNLSPEEKAQIRAALEAEDGEGEKEGEA